MNHPIDDQLADPAARMLSPRRRTTKARNHLELAREQLRHFGIDEKSEFGEALRNVAVGLYRAQSDVTQLWDISCRALEDITRLELKDRVARFNAKKFLCFQVAKILDTLQNPLRKSYQQLAPAGLSVQSRGPYALFDNVPALFAANPVIVRSATYVYACAEWVDEAFRGREFLHGIYSRLINPTSIALANHIVDVEAGPYASDYLAWNFNSGMAAIDAVLSNQLRSGDIVIASRNVYGGTHQLLVDFYAARLNIHLEWFDGHDEEEFTLALADVERRHADRVAAGSRIRIFVESPSNPFGYVIDVPGLCRAAHENGHIVIVDSTVATPFLARPLRRPDVQERPDFVVHSYTKDLIGNGNATAGVVIGEQHRMFLPKGEKVRGVDWSETLFWGEYYIKGAFLDADKAFEVISGMKTLELRMLQKAINTHVLAHYIASHPKLRVHCNALEDDPNHEIAARGLHLSLCPPLFSVDFEEAGISEDAFIRFFDCLSPGLDHQVSLGQSNTVCLCPAFTSHSELDAEALRHAGISRTTLRISVGLEHPLVVLGHFKNALQLAVDPECPGFSSGFMNDDETDRLYEDTYLDVHRRFARSFPPAGRCLH